MGEGRCQGLVKSEIHSTEQADAHSQLSHCSPAARSPGFHHDQGRALHSHHCHLTHIVTFWTPQLLRHNFDGGASQWAGGWPPRAVARPRCCRGQGSWHRAARIPPFQLEICRAPSRAAKSLELFLKTSRDFTTIAPTAHHRPPKLGRCAPERRRLLGRFCESTTWLMWQMLQRTA